MSHSRTVIEPANGLTVLIGPNNCGKSAVVTALQILAHNANSTYVRRHDEKTCEVIVETDDGHEVKWSRSKNGSPRYEIDGQEYDRLKGQVPPQLHAALRLPKVASDKEEFDIHFGEQKEPVFLLNDTGKAAAQFFASSSDAIRLVEMQAKHKTRILQSRRDFKRIDEEVEVLESSIAVLESTSDLDSDLNKLEQQFAALSEDSNRIDLLASLTRRVNQFQRQLVFQSAVTDSLTTLTAPPRLEPVEAIARVTNRIMELDTDLHRQDQRLGPLSVLTAPPALQPTEQIANSIQRIEHQASVSKQTALVAKVFDAMAEPPKLDDDQPLLRLVTSLSKANRSLNGLDNKTRRFAELTEPPQFSELQGIEAAIKNLESASRSFKRLSKQVVEIDKHLSAVESETKQWAAENPTCPTCGSATEANRLLRSGGEECHG